MTQYKLARAKKYMTEDDKKLLEEQMNSEEGISPEMKSRLDSLLHFLKPKRLQKTTGAFGKPGTNRKQDKRVAFAKQMAELKEKLKNDDQQVTEGSQEG